MKVFIFIIIFVLTAAVGVFAQTSRVPAKIAPRNVPFKTVTEISADDWLKLAAALEKEDWQQSATLAAQYLQSLQTENEKKQIAQLRYIQLYALAGQILTANAQNNALESEKAWARLDRVLETFINKEVVMPPRLFTRVCEKKLNVVCEVKDTPNAFRTTATNKEGNGIHSFDYVQFDAPANIKEFDGKEIFLGGILRRAEYNEDKSKPWVLRLFLNKGFMRVVVK